MTAKKILKDILKLYNRNQKVQSKIGKKYKVSQSSISKLLQECGVHRNEIDNGKSVNVRKAWQNPEVRRLCDMIYKRTNEK